MQGQRYVVERSFQDVMSYLSMCQCQVRNGQSWHNHMALVMIAMLFMVAASRTFSGTSLPELSACHSGRQRVIFLAWDTCMNPSTRKNSHGFIYNNQVIGKKLIPI